MPASSTEAPAPRVAEAAIAALRRWYQSEARDLPWRRTHDPYGILVSEIMLQQTRVETVVERYERFLTRFPSLADLAAAEEQDVLAEWSGLGYYRRARNLHRLARIVVQEHDGALPVEHAALLELPGIGAYTAAAIASIAFGRPHLSVDGNVERVLCRVLEIRDDPKRAAVRRLLHGAMTDALESHAPGEVNQALMELGARVCRPRAPRCDTCPIARHCAARDAGVQELIPPRRRATVHEVTEAALVLRRGGRLLLARGHRPGVLADMWEFPTLDSRLRPAHTDDRVATLRAQLIDYLTTLGIDAGDPHHVGEIHHGITDRRITTQVFLASAPARGGDDNHSTAPMDTPTAPAPAQPGATERTAETVERTWLRPEQLDSVPLAASARKTLTLLQRHERGLRR